MEVKNVDITPAFTFIWAIENCPMLLTPEGIESPTFQVDSLENTKWSIAIKDLDEDTFSYSIHRKNDLGPDHIEIVFELQFVARIELRLKKLHHRMVVAKGGILSFEATMDSIFRSNIQFLENDTLTFRCRMWKVGIFRMKPDFCCARARLGLERRTVFWNVKQFNTFLPEHSLNYEIESYIKGVSPLTLSLCMKDGCEQENVWIKILGNGETKFHRFNCEFSVLDVNGKKHFIRKVTHLSTKNDQCILFFQKKKLVDYEMNLLPGDVLTIRCEFVIGSGTVWNAVDFYA